MLQLTPTMSACGSSAGANRSGGVPSRVAVFLDGHLCHDRQITDAPDGRDCRSNLVEIAECLENEEINAAGQQGFGLLAKKCFRFVFSGLSPRLDSDPQRANRARDIPRPLATSRARRTPSTLMSRSRSARPNPRSLIRLAPKVFVSTTSAPARRIPDALPRRGQAR